MSPFEFLRNLCVLEFLKSIRKTNVVIAESPGGGSTLEDFANYGYNRFVGKYGVKSSEGSRKF
jgi:hypothetical protein